MLLNKQSRIIHLGECHVERGALPEYILVLVTLSCVKMFQKLPSEIQSAEYLGCWHVCAAEEVAMLSAV